MRFKLAVLGLLIVAGVAGMLWQSARLKTHEIVSMSDLEDGPKVGEIAPDFTLTDLNGKSWTLSKQKGHAVTIAFFCGCDRCKAAAKEIAIRQRRGQLQSLVTVMSLERRDADFFHKETGIQGIVLSDTSDNTAERYGSGFCPRFWAVTQLGTISYSTGVALESKALTSALDRLYAEYQ